MFICCYYRSSGAWTTSCRRLTCCAPTSSGTWSTGSSAMSRRASPLSRRRTPSRSASPTSRLWQSKNYPGQRSLSCSEHVVKVTSNQNSFWKQDILFKWGLLLVYEVLDSRPRWGEENIYLFCLPPLQYQWSEPSFLPAFSQQILRSSEPSNLHWMRTGYPKPNTTTKTF